MEDILPQDIRLWQELEKTARANLESYGYAEIRTPVLENTSIFIRGIGESTDIVKKEMYTFKDKKERSLTLRPEGTAPIIRAYVEHGLYNAIPEARLYYIGPMFRSERPQKGRSRQFHQIGAEIVGTDSPFADGEVIVQMDRMLKDLGLRDFKIKLNSLGCRKDKVVFGNRIRKYLEGEKSRLCDDCKERIGRNAPRVLDCKKESCIQVVRGAPDVLESLCGRCKEKLDKVKTVLEAMDVEFSEAKNLVRGLDYYTGTVFEITHPALGAQDAIGAGGRYDNLVEDMGGPASGSVGYALGVERILIALGNTKTLALNHGKMVYVASLGDDAKIEGMMLAEEIRKKMNLRVLADIKEASLKSQLRSADRNGACLVVILGENELKDGKVTIRDMDKKNQVSVSRAGVLEEIKKRV